MKSFSTNAKAPYKTQNLISHIGNRGGQGTIEYLVIIAIVVVISLVVVGLVMTQMGSAENVTSTSFEIKNKTGINGISLIDTVAGEDANGLLVLKNMDSETITIDKIVVDGIDHNYDDPIPMGSQLGFKLENIVVCDETKKSYTIKIYFTSTTGLTKTANFETLTINCAPTVNSSGNFVEENVAPAVFDGGMVLDPQFANGRTDWFFESGDWEEDWDVVGNSAVATNAGESTLCPKVTDEDNASAPTGLDGGDYTLTFTIEEIIYDGTLLKVFVSGGTELASYSAGQEGTYNIDFTTEGPNWVPCFSANAQNFPPYYSKITNIALVKR